MTEPTPPDDKLDDELSEIPLLGPARRRALAEMGVTTRAALRALPEAELAAVKIIGAGNAAKITAWLTQNPEAAAPVQSAVSPVIELPDDPPPPPDFDASPAPDALPDDVSLDPPLAAANNALYDALGHIDATLAGLRDKIPVKSRAKKLDRQLEKLATAVSETPESFDTLPAKGVLEVGKAVSRIARELDKAMGGGKWSEKKQDELADDIRARRKALEKALGG